MVVFLNVFLKFFAEEVTDGGHKRLKAAEPRAYQNIVFGAQFLHWRGLYISKTAKASIDSPTAIMIRLTISIKIFFLLYM